jgi:hypothetical protein
MISRVFAMIFALLLSQCTLLLAQTTTATTASSASTVTALSIDPGDGAYEYAGCYNETTLITGSSGVRALAGGTMVPEYHSIGEYHAKQLYSKATTP